MAGRRSGSTVKQRFDVLSPPVLVGVTYIALFAMSAIDIIVVTDGRFRLRSEFLLYQGLSIPALTYLAVGYLLFVIGYYVKAGKLIAGLSPIRSGHLRASRIPILTVVIFCFTFAILLAYSYEVGYGRRVGASDTGNGGFLDGLVLLGEMSLIPLSLGLYYYWNAKKYARDRGNAAANDAERPRVTKGFSFFIWKVMLPLQLGIGIWIGTRSRVVEVVLITLAAYHYTYRRLRVSTLACYAALLIIAVPVLGVVRDNMFNGFRPESRLSLSGAWDSFMDRTSALEAFMIAYDNPDSTPPPDPMWLVLVSGTVPRFLWRNKPGTTFGHDFSVWITGRKNIDGYGPGLPGELMLGFGHLGGLLAMFGLGVFWRILYEATIGAGFGTGSAFIYFSLLPALTGVEMGFVTQYGLVIRFLLVGLLIYWVASARVAPKLDNLGVRYRPSGRARTVRAMGMGAEAAPEDHVMKNA
jgi:hypothetical protein